MPGMAKSGPALFCRAALDPAIIMLCACLSSTSKVDVEGPQRMKASQPFHNSCEWRQLDGIRR